MKFYLICVAFIISLTLTSITLGWLPINMAIEIATTLIAFLVTGACLVQIHYQHRKNDRKERRLRRQVLIKIYALSPSLIDHKAVQEYLALTLESDGLEQRLKKLARYQHNTSALKSFIHRLKQREAAKETLKDLGLSWEQRV